MENYSVLQTMTLADIVGVFLILVIVLGSFSLMWYRDYSVYLEDHNKQFRLFDFIRKEQLYLFLFLMFLFLIGGEILLYSYL